MESIGGFEHKLRKMQNWLIAEKEWANIKIERMGKKLEKRTRRWRIVKQSEEGSGTQKGR